QPFRYITTAEIQPDMLPISHAVSPLANSRTISMSTSVQASISSTQANSFLPWQLYPPVQRFGQGIPIKESLAPSVPPRTASSRGSPPALRTALLAASINLG